MTIDILEEIFDAYGRVQEVELPFNRKRKFSRTPHNLDSSADTILHYSRHSQRHSVHQLLQPKRLACPTSPSPRRFAHPSLLPLPSRAVSLQAL